MAENAVTLTRNQLRFIAIGQFLELSKLDNGIKVYDSNIAIEEQGTHGLIAPDVANAVGKAIQSIIGNDQFE